MGEWEVLKLEGKLEGIDKPPRFAKPQRFLTFQKCQAKTQC